jgi:hypothetical protein
MQRNIKETTDYLRVTQSTDNHDKKLSADEIRLAKNGKTDFAFYNESLQFAGTEYKRHHAGASEQNNRLDIDSVAGMELLTEEQQNALLVKTFYALQKQFANNMVARPGALCGVSMNMVLPVGQTQQCDVVTVDCGGAPVYFFAHNKVSNVVKVLSNSEYFVDETHLIQSHRKYRAELAFDFEKKLKLSLSKSRHSQFNQRFGLYESLCVHRSRFDQVNSENDIYKINATCPLDAEVIERVLQAQFSQGQPTVLNMAQSLSFSSLGNSYTDVTVIVSRVNNHAEAMKNSLAYCVYSGVETSMYSDLMRVMFLPLMKAYIHLEMIRLKDITISLPAYLHALEAAMHASDDPVALFRHLTEAKWIKEQLQTIFRHTSKLFSSPQSEDPVLKDQLQQLEFQIDEVYEWYPDSLLQDVSQFFPNFPGVKARILKICEEIKAGPELDKPLRQANRS